MGRTTPSSQYGSLSRGQQLVHDLEEAVKVASGKEACKLCVAIADLDSLVQNSVNRAIAARRPDGKRAIGSRALTKILQSDGIDVGEYSVTRHLRENHNE